MDQNTTNAIFNLMQNIVDKLDNISQNQTTNKGSELNAMTNSCLELKDFITKSSTVQHSFLENYKNLENRIKELSEKSNKNVITNNYKEFSLFGKESSFKPVTMIIILFCLVITWSSIKYLPSYFNEQSVLKKEKEEYQFFYQYTYLNQFKYTDKTTANTILKKIKENDEGIIKDYHILLQTYTREQRKRELEEELQKLKK